ncbi:molybdate transport system substrate-binding protein [Ruminiclostridium sufflavum DSM 19573]|uniref:Molybdate transport system substrate-binding protein n=1 Tax=Ruminiclostridium sufflavum DSM 19573 TaxID=1121337 RepID=A0A318Y1A5_9FIRM|nr:molybdate ABC transporter substrate-binding protein [Ruminiclostridium sufflavum]PYG84828.1 molybdate transport system substrate-binding protein [Ruminiclostridium sufflavum DSM 19573]
MRTIRKNILMLFIAVILILTGCGSQSTPSADSGSDISKASPSDTAEKTEIFVAAAASLTDATKELVEMYKKVEPDIAITCTFSSSGTLQTQIEQGAPADIFLSAAKKQVTALEEKGLVKEGSKKELLKNKVVLITPAGSTKNIESFEELAADKVSTVALGEPSSVPVGQYAEEILTYLKILDKVKAKANYGSDVRQVLTWVESGEVDCGVVYSTDAALSDKIKVVCEAPEGSHKPVIYPAVVLKSSKHPAEAQAFLDYLSTSQAEYVFEKYGFEMNN